MKDINTKDALNFWNSLENIGFGKTKFTLAMKYFNSKYSDLSEKEIKFIYQAEVLSVVDKKIEKLIDDNVGYVDYQQAVEVFVNDNGKELYKLLNMKYGKI